MQQFDPDTRVVKYNIVIQKIAKGLAVELDIVIKEVPTFIK